MQAHHSTCALVIWPSRYILQQSLSSWSNSQESVSQILDIVRTGERLRAVLNRCLCDSCRGTAESIHHGRPRRRGWTETCRMVLHTSWHCRQGVAGRLRLEVDPTVGPLESEHPNGTLDGQAGNSSPSPMRDLTMFARPGAAIEASSLNFR